MLGRSRLEYPLAIGISVTVLFDEVVVEDRVRIILASSQQSTNLVARTRAICCSRDDVAMHFVLREK